MQKYSFLDDYSEGCHSRLLQALSDTNLLQQNAYGQDDYSGQAKALLKQKLGSDTASIYFVASGTLANLVIIAACLRPHEAVIAPSSGHIVVREAGAVEATGHKIISVAAMDGKLCSDSLLQALDDNAHFPHMVKPKLVYLSNATETGTLYSKAELEAIAAICQQRDLLLLLDGARLGAALAASTNDVSLNDLCRLTDVFWFGGTKVGALFGEAIVINNPELQIDFEFNLKQRGALLAKSRVLGLQFYHLLNDDLYLQLAKKANDLALVLAKGMQALGYDLAAVTQTNQVFVILPMMLIERLQTSFEFYIWKRIDGENAIVRLVTSWATDLAAIKRFILSCEQASDARYLVLN